MTIELTPEVHRLPNYDTLYNPPAGTNTIVLIGGRGGAKTYEVSKYIAYSAVVGRKRCVVLRDEMALIKESILTEVWARYDTANESGLLDGMFTKSVNELKDRKTGETLIYTKGFRASSNSKQANLKGAANIDIAVIEEAEDIRDVEKYNTFVDSLRKEGCLIIIMLNTPDVGHWLVKRFFNTESIEDGYYKITPKVIPGFACIQTTFKDNPFLPAHIVSNYNGYGDPSHHLYNKHYYLTAILGYASTGRKGQVFTKVKPIKLAEYLRLPFKEYYGQDFGTSSPAAMVGVKFDGNTVYAREINYKPMDVLSIGKLYSQLQLSHTDRIVCDYAEPDSIEKLSKGFKDLGMDDYMKYPALAKGFHAVPCPTKDINGHLSIMASLNIYICEESNNFWEEVNNYVYAQDKYKNYTNDPIDDYNHLMDAFRYVVIDQRGKTKMFGI
jgi:phage terminase large subunit